MRYIRVASACAALFASSLAPLPSSAEPAAPGTPAPSEILSAGTPISVMVVDKVNSATSHAGDTFAVRATENTVIDGWVIISRGALGEGEVISATRARSHGHPGELSTRLLWVTSVDGNKIPLTGGVTPKVGRGQTGRASTMTIIATTIYPIGLFAHNFYRGADVGLDTAAPYVAQVDHSVVVRVAQRSADTSGYAPVAPAGAATR